MAHPLHHAESSVRKYGGKPEDYLAIHAWFDESKVAMANFRHRALRHHSFGIFEAEKVFGIFIVNADGKRIPVRFIAEQHVREDCGGIIPSPIDWLRGITAKPWMSVGKIAGDAPPTDLDSETTGAFAETAASLECWRKAVAAGETTLGHREWLDRMGLLITSRPASSTEGGL
jgi:hypothetical protein